MPGGIAPPLSAVGPPAWTRSRRWRLATGRATLPLEDASLDVAIFCLSLMGSNYVEFLREAHRVLRPRTIVFRLS